jgi:hypothetical protein
MMIAKGYTIRASGLVVTWHPLEFVEPDVSNGQITRIVLVTTHGVVAVPMEELRHHNRGRA